MNSSEFIKNEIIKLVESVPSIKCVYEFDEKENSHRIEVFPRSEFLTNKQYIELECKLYADFIENFPKESLAIISDEKMFPLQETFKVEGCKYTLYSVETIHPIANIEVKQNISFGNQSKNKVRLSLASEQFGAQFKYSILGDFNSTHKDLIKVTYKEPVGRETTIDDVLTQERFVA